MVIIVVFSKCWKMTLISNKKQFNNGTNFCFFFYGTDCINGIHVMRGRVL